MPVGTADDDADLDDGTGLVRLGLQLADRRGGLDLSEIEVTLQLVAVPVELLAELVGLEDAESFVSGDQRCRLLPLGRIDRAVRGGDESAHRHAAVGELLVLELAGLGL